MYTICATPLSAGGIESPTKFFKKKKGGGALTRPKFLEGDARKEGGDLFQVGCNFYIKNKPKSEIFHDKKS